MTKNADGAEFVTLTFFDSLDAVRAFAGEQHETAVISDEARAVLRDFDTTARHFTIVVEPDDLTQRLAGGESVLQCGALGESDCF